MCDVDHDFRNIVCWSLQFAALMLKQKLFRASTDTRPAQELKQVVRQHPDKNLVCVTRTQMIPVQPEFSIPLLRQPYSFRPRGIQVVVESQPTS